MFVLEALQPFITCTTVLVSVLPTFGPRLLGHSFSLNVRACIVHVCVALRRWCKRFRLRFIACTKSTPFVIRNRDSENLDRNSTALTSHKLENSKTRYQATRQGKSLFQRPGHRDLPPSGSVGMAAAGSRDLGRRWVGHGASSPPTLPISRPARAKNHVLRCKMPRDLRRKCRVACGIFLACSSDSHAQADAMLHATFRNEQTSFFFILFSFLSQFHVHACTCTSSNLSWVHSLCDVEVAATQAVVSAPRNLCLSDTASRRRDLSDHLTSDIPRAGRFQAHERPAHRSRKTNLCVDCCGTCSVRHRAPAWVRQTRPCMVGLGLVSSCVAVV